MTLKQYTKKFNTYVKKECEKLLKSGLYFEPRLVVESELEYPFKEGYTAEEWLIQIMNPEK